MRYFKSLWKYI